MTHYATIHGKRVKPPLVTHLMAHLIVIGANGDRHWWINIQRTYLEKKKISKKTSNEQLIIKMLAL